jgi:hypothetical protein
VVYTRVGLQIVPNGLLQTLMQFVFRGLRWRQHPRPETTFLSLCFSLCLHVDISALASTPCNPDKEYPQPETWMLGNTRRPLQS